MKMLKNMIDCVIRYYYFYDRQSRLLSMVKDTSFQKKRLLQVGGKYLDLSVPKIAGILNVTPDSFYDGGKYFETNQLVKQVEKMLNEGADLIDVGAFSSRPGAVEIGEEEEYNRLSRALGAIRDKWPETIISVDTTRANLAGKVIENFQVNIINDISGGMADPEMFDVIAAFHVPYIMMHMRGTPANMQLNTDYSDILSEIIEFFKRQIFAIREKGVNDIIIDPGIGFSKTLEHNYQILHHLDIFQIFNLPILIGVSRKSMIHKLLEISPNQALNGTTVLHTLALERSADILRVHDVLEAKQTIRLFRKTHTEGENYALQHPD